MKAAPIFILGGLCLLPPLPLIGWPGMAPWAALLLGCAVALSLGNPLLKETRLIMPRLLAFSVVGLGFAMNLRVVASVGLKGLGITLGGISLTLLLGYGLGKWLKVGERTALLISVGTAICGGSAIAAASPVLGADEEEMSLSLATVFLLNASALLIFPFIGGWLGLSQSQFGLWAALAIHDTSSVVGAASTYGAEALTIATTTKLARALWIVPVTLLLGLWVRQRSNGEVRTGRAKRPWFILAFLIASALVTWMPFLQGPGLFLASAAKRGLVLTLFLLGLGLSRDALKRLGPRPLVQGLILWILVSAGSLAAILAPGRMH